MTKEQQIAALDPGNIEFKDVVKTFKRASAAHRDDADVALMALKSGPV
jgi:hypothetical protein